MRASLTLLMSAGRKIHSAVKELVHHLHQLQLPEDLRSVLQRFNASSDRPKDFPSPARCTTATGSPERLAQRAGSNHRVAALHIFFRLRHEPLPQLSINAADQRLKLFGQRRARNLRSDPKPQFCSQGLCQCGRRASQSASSICEP